MELKVILQTETDLMCAITEMEPIYTLMHIKFLEDEEEEVAMAVCPCEYIGVEPPTVEQFCVHMQENLDQDIIFTSTRQFIEDYLKELGVAI